MLSADIQGCKLPLHLGFQNKLFFEQLLVSNTQSVHPQSQSQTILDIALKYKQLIIC
ncbi:unnamed protein product [Paramecium primaurelia]|uniref:Uncharacterized protein n=1 Tax=Paramecium primaurelia TaxID=5886 RepID=A0A8S1Q760_PARPR|nr:unnamed protein product [Paramecium primaurelia]